MASASDASNVGCGPPVAAGQTASPGRWLTQAQSSVPASSNVAKRPMAFSPTNAPAMPPPWRQDSRPSGRAPQKFAVDDAFGNLHGVERGALAQIVGNDPHAKTVLDRGILADARNIGCIFAG